MILLCVSYTKEDDYVEKNSFKIIPLYFLNGILSRILLFEDSDEP